MGRRLAESTLAARLTCRLSSTRRSAPWSAPPGTMVIGTRSRAAGLPVRYEISGPGPSGPVPAASTRIEMLGSSLIKRQQLVAARAPRGYRRSASSRRSARSRRTAAAAAARLPRAALRAPVLDRAPMLQLGRLDHVEQRHAGRRYAQRGGRRNARRPDAPRVSSTTTRKHALMCDLCHRGAYASLSILAQDQAPRNGRLASHPATTAVSTAIAP